MPKLNYVPYNHRNKQSTAPWQIEREKNRQRALAKIAQKSIAIEPTIQRNRDKEEENTKTELQRLLRHHNLVDVLFYLHAHAEEEAKTFIYEEEEKLKWEQLSELLDSACEVIEEEVSEDCYLIF